MIFLLLRCPLAAKKTPCQMSRAFLFVAVLRYMRAIMASPKAEQLISCAPSIRRAKS